jgi:hypothetical protein
MAKKKFSFFIQFQKGKFISENNFTENFSSSSGVILRVDQKRSFLLCLFLANYTSSKSVCVCVCV